jgi:hypothetical protein
MKIAYVIVFAVATTAVQAHESIVPHEHPHGPSMLPGVDLIGLAALILAVAVILVMKMRQE